MGAELDIVVGIGVISALFSYISFEFLQPRSYSSELEEHITKIVGQMFFSMSMLFILLLVNTMLLITINAGISYLQDSIMTVALEVIYYFCIVGIVAYLAVLFANIFDLIKSSIVAKFGSRKKSGVRQ